MATIIHNPFTKPQSPTDRRRRSFMVSKLQKNCIARLRLFMKITTPWLHVTPRKYKSFITKMLSVTKQK
ncbi:hypothetical protein HanXRQr2_Chr16g0767991 [Helianthus annuus]|uniref:Uncharacterized protein n=1 Tax=Helianthus annuus TaxID=4232 RepID=A0A9K3DVW7_HELAN|nr:hypothetical protein HanXRQr2_Chr16g0767991 [Helianthus annuus]